MTTLPPKQQEIAAKILSGVRFRVNVYRKPSNPSHGLYSNYETYRRFPTLEEALKFASGLSNDKAVVITSHATGGSWSGGRKGKK